MGGASLRLRGAFVCRERTLARLLILMWGDRVAFPSHLPIPEEVLRIARKLEGAGFETWCVGGAVRDNLLGYESKDFDMATAATPPEIRKLFRRTIPIGVEHGTVAVLDRNGQPHEVTTFRRDVQTDGRHAVVEFGVSLEDDLARRDFTINAIAHHPLRHEWRDPFDGAADLAARTIRAVGDPTQRFREDYLRIVRAIRFAARFGFTIEDDTWSAAKANAAGLQRLSAERVRDEWFKGIQGAQKLSKLVEMWSRVGALSAWLEELVREETMGSAELTVVDRFEKPDPVLVTAYLSSDAATTLTRLRCSNAEIARGAMISAFRGTVPNPSAEVEVRRWMSTVGSAVDDLLSIAVAERRGAALCAAVADVRVSGAPLGIGDLAVRGDDLVEIGIPEGPEVGKVLRTLLDAVIERPAFNTKPLLLDLARGLGASGPTSGSPLRGRAGGKEA